MVFFVDLEGRTYFKGCARAYFDWPTGPAWLPLAIRTHEGWFDIESDIEGAYVLVCPD